MHRSLVGIARLALVLALAIPGALRAQTVRAVTGLVVDAQSGTPVADVLVTIDGTNLRAVTDAAGRFTLNGVALGNRLLVVRHVAYGEHSQAVVVNATGPLDFRIRISSQAIAMSPMVVEVQTAEDLAQRASGTATHVIDRAAIEQFSQTGQGILLLLAAKVPSLRVVAGCVEYRLQVYTPPGLDTLNGQTITTNFQCRDMTVYLDGIRSHEGSEVLKSLSMNDVERIEVLSPAEAGVQYTDSDRGVVVVETRSGRRPESSLGAGSINGFGWSEPKPYPLLRVVGLSALGDAVGAGLGSRKFFDCSVDSGSLPVTPVRCTDFAGIGAAVFTGAITGMLTRRLGRTGFSAGRELPAFLIGSVTTSVGYLLYLRGVRDDRSGYRTAGTIVLGVALPVSLTLSDRVFREPR